MKAVSQNGQQVNKEDIDDTVSAIMFDIIDLSLINILLTNRLKRFEENTEDNMPSQEWEETLHQRYAINHTFLWPRCQWVRVGCIWSILNA